MNPAHITNKYSEILVNFRLTCDELSKLSVVLMIVMTPFSTIGSNVALILLMITWFLGGNIRKKAQEIWTHPIFWLSFFLFFVFVIGAIYSPAPLKDVNNMLLKMVRWPFIAFFMPLMKEEKWRRFIIISFLASVLVLIALSFFQMNQMEEVGAKLWVLRHRISTSLTLAFTSFYIAHYIYSSLNFRQYILGLGLLCVVGFAVLFISDGRSGYVVFAALWALFCIQRLRARQLIFGALSLLLIFGAAAMYSTPFQQRLAAVREDIAQYQLGNNDTSVGIRLELMQQAWLLAKQHCLLGHGTGSVRQVYEEHAKSKSLMQSSNLHNEYLNIFFQLGLMGIITFVGFFVWLFQYSYKLPHPEKWLLQGIILAMAVGGLANSWLMDFITGRFCIFVIAFCLSTPAIVRKENKLYD